ncbi:MAG: hypothetical protein ACI4ME_04645 [Aristaeellaceae bacterium]
MTRRYKIVMHTPLGARYGTIALHADRSRLFGELELLKRSQPFDGTIDENGNCSFCGTLVSLVRTIRYRAIGQITDSAIELKLSGDRNEYHITGVPIKEKEAGN